MRLAATGVFTVAVFASAFLLFAVQPIVAHLILPRLGGSPEVWNTCVCFFQAALLLGYGYAHLVVMRLRPWAQPVIHAVILGAALLVLPLSLGQAVPPTDAHPALWLLGLLARTIALPFVAIAATAPLLLAWFARAKEPYFLYAASNAGSLLALLSYPVLIETTLDLSDQARLWSFGFAITAGLIVLCGIIQHFARAQSAAPDIASLPPSGRISVAERLRWVALAFVPSALMLAVTTHVTTDIAATPLFWVVPLAIYIVTFILAFARRAPIGQRALLPLQAVTLAGAAVIGLSNITQSILALLVPVVAFALTAAVCHTELALRRPDPRQLTGFFLLLSVGGALGGVFNALVAPLLFKVPLEYPLLLVATCLLRPAPVSLPSKAREDWAARGDLLLPGALAVIVLALLWGAGSSQVARIGVVAVPALVLLWFARRRVRLAFALAFCMLIPLALESSRWEFVDRSFFGVLRVRQVPSDELRVLLHGTTIHGVQSLRSDEQLTPFGYYHRAGPFGRLFAALERSGHQVIAVGVVGLGSGALGCYARPGQSWTFREIDPLVLSVAENQRLFHLLHGCGNDPTVVLGDARLTLAADADAQYDVLIIDAFSSDSVPVHLLTREALALYFRHLKPGGLVVFHVSNRYLDLVPVVSRLAADAKASVRHLRTPAGDDILRRPPTEVVVVAAPGGILDALDGWGVPQPGPALWTDERSNIAGAIRWR